MSSCATLPGSIAPVATSIPGIWDILAPAEVGTIVFELEVNDGQLTDTDCVAIESVNLAPSVGVTCPAGLRPSKR